MKPRYKLTSLLIGLLIIASSMTACGPAAAADFMTNLPVVK